MRVTLISPRLAIQKRDFLGSGVPYWPVELATLAAFLRERGDQVAVLDLFGEAPSVLEDAGDHYLQGRCLRDRLDSAAVSECDLFIVFAIGWMSHREILSILRTLRDVRPGTPRLVLENAQAVTAYALPRAGDELLAAGADGLICGEPYFNWDEIRAWLSSRRPGAAAPKNVLSSSCVRTKRVERLWQRSARYPVPAWELFSLAGRWSMPYAHGPKIGRYLPILTSRGCPWPCDFCVLPETSERRWRACAPEDVVEEIITLRDRFDVHHFQVEDVNPTVNGARWRRIAELLIERKAGVTYALVSGTKAETLDPSLVPLYAASGCRYISVSPESGSSRLLDRIGKKFDHARALELIRACRTHGVATQCCFITGHPDETVEDHRLSCQYLRDVVRAGADEVAVFAIMPLPGSELATRGAVDLVRPDALPSFSPKGRRDWAHVERRRRELIRVFLNEKLKLGPELLIQGLQAIARRPRTKLENLPWRMAYVYWAIAKLRARSAIDKRRVSMRHIYRHP